LSTRSLLFILISITLSGCRFGNREDSPVAPPESYKSEYFRAVPTSYTLYASYTDSSLDSADAPLSSIPTSVKNIFTDPVGLITPVQGQNENPIFFSTSSDPVGQETSITGSDISYEAYSDVVTLWQDPSCQTQVQLFQSGTLDRRSLAPFTTTGGDILSIAGRLSLDLTVFRVIEGNCDADLARLSECTQDDATCSLDERQAANALFSMYTEAGALTLPSAKTLSFLAYQVIFE
jgi:hypothetical protein